MNKEQAIWGTIGAIVVPVFEFMYGAGEAVAKAMIVLAFFIAMDWISGSSAAKKDKSYASKYGIDGIKRTFFMILLPAGGHGIDMIFGLPGILFGMFVAGLLYHTLKSMLANCIRAGWGDWLPINILELAINWVGSELDNKIKRAADRGGKVAKKSEAE